MKTANELEWETNKSDCTFTPRVNVNKKTVQPRYTAEPKHRFERPKEHVKFGRSFAELPPQSTPTLGKKKKKGKKKKVDREVIRTP